MHPASPWSCRQPWPVSPRRNRRHFGRSAGSPPSRRRPDRLLDGEFADFARLSSVDVRGAAGEGALEVAERIAAHALDAELGFDLFRQKIGNRAAARQLDIAVRIFAVWASLTGSGVPSAPRIPSDSAMTQRPSRSQTDLTSDKNLASSKTRSGR